MTQNESDNSEPLIGITQGRLSAPVPGRIQTFPALTWQEEFRLAKQAGLRCIEWVYQSESEANNPLATDSGANQVLRTIELYGVPVYSVSADIYMKQRLVGEHGEVCRLNVEHLEHLLRRAKRVNAHHVMVPFVDSGRLETQREREAMIRVIDALAPQLEGIGIELHIEADWPAGLWANTMREIATPSVRICYDIGDRAALGYEPEEDLALLAPWLGSVHIKDRLRGGGTVPLGTGQADLQSAIETIVRHGYRSPWILQAAPEPETDPFAVAVRNRTLVEDLIRTTARSDDIRLHS